MHAPLPNPPLDEKATLMEMMERSRDRYLTAIASIPEETARRHVAGVEWSIIEVAEHVATAERQMLAAFHKLGTPGSADRANDERIRQAQTDRGRKQQAPERARPSGRCATLAEAREQFVANRKATLAALEQVHDELRNRITPHPIFGNVDGYQLFTIIALHAERHAAQVQEIAGKLAAEGGNKA